tara:strand:- start:188 stop:466 length:279 start_codon:yes stop_codon:yes gene_type:complete
MDQHTSIVLVILIVAVVIIVIYIAYDSHKSHKEITSNSYDLSDSHDQGHHKGNHHSSNNYPPSPFPSKGGHHQKTPPIIGGDPNTWGPTTKP